MELNKLCSVIYFIFLCVVEQNVVAVGVPLEMMATMGKKCLKQSLFLIIFIVQFSPHCFLSLVVKGSHILLSRLTEIEIYKTKTALF